MYYIVECWKLCWKRWIPFFDPEEFTEEFEAMTKTAEKVQRKTLRKILEENGRTKYLQKCCLDEKTNLHSFAQCVPVVSFLNSHRRAH